MKWVWTQLMVMMLLMGVTSGEHTLSYFFDFEGSTGNTFAATNLDQGVAGQPIDGLLCQPNDELSTILYTSNLGALDFSYGFSVENTSGTLCAGLEATLSTGSTTLYNGSLTTLDAANLVLLTEGDEEFTIELRLMPGATQSGTCQFDTTWFAEQLEGVEFLGFSDTETITHFVNGSGTGVGAGCMSDSGERVYLHLSKAISGETLGYDLSDFSYRVTGNGIDIIVPHNQTVALPIGTYTIEELVPPDFIKPDWRIGWYGECESGDTFFTTVTIDEGNIDHGTLYCQADNQYRPDQRRREHEQARTTGNRQELERDREEPTELESNTETETETENLNEGDGQDGADGTGGGTAGQSINLYAPGADAGLTPVPIEDASEESPAEAEPAPEPVEEPESEIEPEPQ